MLFIVIGIVAAAFGLLDYFEIVDTPTSLVLTGVGAVTLLAGIGQLQKDRRAKADAPQEAPAVPATNGHAANGTVAANGSFAQGQTNGTAEKTSLWQRLNKPVGGKDAGGKHRSRRDRKAGEVPEPSASATPVAAAAPGQPALAPVAQAEAPPEEKTSFWKKLNQPVGKGPSKKENAAPGEEGKKKRRRRGKDDEDEGPLFPETLAEGPDPFQAPPPGAIPPAPVPVAPASSPAPDQPVAAPDAPGAPGDVAWDLPPQQAPLQGTAAGPVPPAAPDAPQEVAEQAAPVATAVAEPQAQAPRRGRRVCNYCWEPNDPTAAVCSACGAGL